MESRKYVRYLHVIFETEVLPVLKWDTRLPRLTPVILATKVASGNATHL